MLGLCFTAIGGVIGPIMGGWIFDVTGNYTLAFWVLIVVLVIAMVMAMIMMIIAALLTSICVAREWERGTMEQLISTPVKAPELIIGKFIPYFAIGFFDLLVGVIMARFLFHVPFRGSYLLLFFLSSLFLTGALSQGILISVVAKTKIACGGGSSRVFRSALKAAVDSMWTSSMI